MYSMTSDRPSRSPRRAGLALIAGVIIVIISNINPIVAVYAEPDLLAGIAMIADNQIAWVLQQIVFLAGLLWITIGLIVLGNILRTTPGRRLAEIALVGLIVATSIWVIIAIIRIVVPVTGIRQTADLPPLFGAAMNGWLFQAFNHLMLGALAIYGGALLQSGWPRWLGLTTIILSSLMLGIFSFFGQGPPEMLCVVTLILGIAALRWGARQESQRQPASIRGR
jgi:hypothetical protein